MAYANGANNVECEQKLKDKIDDWLAWDKVSIMSKYYECKYAICDFHIINSVALYRLIRNVSQSSSFFRFFVSCSLFPLSRIRWHGMKFNHWSKNMIGPNWINCCPHDCHSERPDCVVQCEPVLHQWTIWLSFKRHRVWPNIYWNHFRPKIVPVALFMAMMADIIANGMD